jgi:hypothetical protein
MCSGDFTKALEEVVKRSRIGRGELVKRGHGLRGSYRDGGEQGKVGVVGIGAAEQRLSRRGGAGP